VDLHVAPGEAVCVVGNSGSGKTTLLNLAGGLLRPTAGTISILDRDLGALSEAALADMRRQSVGFVFQFACLVPSLTAADNVELPLVLNKWPRAGRRQRVSELLAAADLTDKAKVTADYLSGGEQQRVAILRAVAHRPKLVLMDEPTSCLDSHNADRLIDLVMQMHDGAEAAILTTTHDPRMAVRFRRSLRISDGRLAEPEPDPTAN
jgi:putative ABC transport system ATP-binding protein